MTARNWRDELAEIGRDLFNMEVNTILASGITGRKMPIWPIALIEIAEIYARYLTGTACLDVSPFWQVTEEAELAAVQPTFTKLPAPVNPEDLQTSALTFLRLRYAAQAVLANRPAADAAGFAVDAKRREILYRIMRNADQLKAVVQFLGLKGVYEPFLNESRQGVITAQAGGTVPPAPTESAVRIRKIWDIGTDEIVLQTVVQLDGDIISRIKQDFDIAQQKPLWNAHQEHVRFGGSYWKELFEILATLVGDAFSRLFGRT